MVDLVEVLQRLLGISSHGGRARGPVDGAHLTVLSNKLEGLHQTEGLINTAANGAVIQSSLDNNTLQTRNEGQFLVIQVKTSHINYIFEWWDFN